MSMKGYRIAAQTVLLFVMVILFRAPAALAAPDMSISATASGAQITVTANMWWPQTYYYGYNGYVVEGDPNSGCVTKVLGNTQDSGWYQYDTASCEGSETFVYIQKLGSSSGPNRISVNGAWYYVSDWDPQLWRLTVTIPVPENGTYAVWVERQEYAVLRTDPIVWSYWNGVAGTGNAPTLVMDKGNSNFAIVNVTGAAPDSLTLDTNRNTLLAQQRDQLAALVSATQALVNKDTVPPTVSLAWANGATITTSSSYTLYVYASDNSGSALQMRRNGGAWQPYSSAISVPLSVGYNEVVIDVKDPGGNVATARIGMWRK